MHSVAVFLCVLSVAVARPQFAQSFGGSPFRQDVPASSQFHNRSPITLTSRTELFDEAGQYQRGHHQSDGTSVQETGTLVPNHENNGLVLHMRGNYRFITPEGQEVLVEWIANDQGFQILNSNAVPVVPSPAQPTF